MTLNQIKKAVDAGKTVHWASDIYRVIKDKKGGYGILCDVNESYIGLTWTDGKTMNGKPEQFYLED